MSDSERSIDRRSVLKGVGGAAALGVVGTAAFATSGAASASIDINISESSVSNDEGDVDFVGVDLNKTISWDGFDVPVRYIGFKHELALEENNDGWHLLYGDTSEDGNFSVSDRLPDGWFIDGNGTPREGSDYGSDDEYIINYAGDKTKGTKGSVHAGVTWEIINDAAEPGVNKYDYGYPAGSGTPHTPIDWADDLSVSKDLDSQDNTKTRTVVWKTTLKFYTENGNGNRVPVEKSDGQPEVVGEERFPVTVTNEVGTVSSDSDGSSKTK